MDQQAPRSEPTSSGSGDRGGLAPLVALGGAVVVIIGSFLPWISIVGDSSSGWDLYRDRADAGAGVFVVDHLFDRDWPFLTGLTTLLMGAGLALLAIVVIALGRRSTQRTYRLPTLVAYPIVAASALATLAFGSLNFMSYFGKPAGTDASLELGMVLVQLGFLTAFLAFVVGNSTRTAGPQRDDPGGAPAPR